MNTTGTRRPSRDTSAYSIEETSVLDPYESTSSTTDAVVKYLLDRLILSDPKLDFDVRNVNTAEVKTAAVKQFYYFLVWRDLSRPGVCRLSHDDGYFASVELVSVPPSWSNCDIDKHVYSINKTRYLNGLSLRDDLAHTILALLNTEFELKANKNLVFKKIEFDKASVRLLFDAGCMLDFNQIGESSRNW
jgi:hypothetical protein